MPGSISNHAVATGSNRLNSSGIYQADVFNRTSQFWTSVIPAGRTIPVAISGSSFVVTYASQPPSIRPNPSGSFNSYAQGTGLNTGGEHPFVSLDVNNPFAVDILVQIFVGFDGFIDNRLILDQTQFPLVPVGVCTQASTQTTIDIPDLSGTAITDINGGTWYAVSREAIYISNVDAGVTFNLQKTGAVNATGPAVATVFPTTSLRYPASGDYSINVGGGNVPAIVSDVYFALARVA